MQIKFLYYILRITVNTNIDINRSNRELIAAMMVDQINLIHTTCIITQKILSLSLFGYTVHYITI